MEKGSQASLYEVGKMPRIERAQVGPQTELSKRVPESVLQSKEK